MELLQPVRERADYIINTGSAPPGPAAQRDMPPLRPEGGESALPVNVSAFGYKFGIPMEADLVFRTCALLPTPITGRSLKNLTGHGQRRVFEYVMSQPDTGKYMDAAHRPFWSYQLHLRFGGWASPPFTIRRGLQRLRAAQQLSAWRGPWQTISAAMRPERPTDIALT
jgi:hypothetical protein